MYGSLEVTNLLDVVHGDDLAVDLDALLSELLSNDESVDRAIEVASGGNLGNNNNLHVLQSLSTLLSLSLSSSDLASLLSQVFSEHLLSAL